VETGGKSVPEGVCIVKFLKLFTLLMLGTFFRVAVYLQRQS